MKHSLILRTLAGVAVFLAFACQADNMYSTNYCNFVFFANLPQYVKDPYKRFLENQIRKHFNFTGCPIQIYIRQK